ncbi:unnamed protein product, partial [marine sediment metagenome]
ARCSRVSALLERVKRYSAIVKGDSFSNGATGEMKDNVKDILDEVKDEVDQIKSEVDNW